MGVSKVGPIDAGPWMGRRCIGKSLAMGPTGVLAKGPADAEAFLTIDV